MESKSHALVAGLFALCLGVAALFIVYWFGGSSDRTHDYVVVTKQNIGGLDPQAQVRYRGIRVGKVSDIRLDPDDYTNILVTIAVNEDVPLTRGTVAKLNYQGVTGLAHILLLETGKDPQPLQPNDKKPPRIAMIPSLLDDLGENGTATLRQARQLMLSADALLNEENRRHLSASLAGLEKVSSSLQPVLQHLDGTLVQLNKLLADRNVDNLSQTLGELGPLVGDVRLLVGKMQKATDRIDGAVGEFSASGGAALLPRLNEMAGDFSQTSRQLSRVLGVLESSPQGVLFGVPPPPPGPGEPGFIVPGGK